MCIGDNPLIDHRSESTRLYNRNLVYLSSRRSHPRSDEKPAVPVATDRLSRICEVECESSTISLLSQKLLVEQSQRENQKKQDSDQCIVEIQIAGLNDAHPFCD